MATQQEKVACIECNDSIMLKNLKTHYSRHHPGLKVKYKSIQNRNVLDLFKEKETLKNKVAETATTSVITEPPLKKTKAIESAVDYGAVNKTDASLKELMETVSSEYILKY